MNYYSQKLSGKRLEECYNLAPARIKEYLQAELDYVLGKTSPHQDVLELGCGYGRFLAGLFPKIKNVFGIDSSMESLLYGRSYLKEIESCHLSCMDALNLGFADNSFDRVVCIQNGISAFQVDQTELIKESLRVCKSGGQVMFSSYSDQIWEERLKWFELQLQAGLIGEILYEQSVRGTIVTEDGFRATTVTPEQFKVLAQNIGAEFEIEEVNNSSVFCILHRHSV